MSSLDGIRVALVGPLPPPAGGMANQTRQLGELLRSAGATVEVVQSNAPYRPAWVTNIPMLRAFFRLVPYMVALWRVAGRCDLMHVMANSGWSWHLLAAPAIRIGSVRRRPVVVNYRGGEAAEFLSGSARVVAASLRRSAALIVPSGYLKAIFESYSMHAEIVPNIVDLDRFHPDDNKSSCAPHVVVARNLEPIYDNAAAIRCLALVRQKHPNARLTVAGTGPEEEHLRALAVQLGLERAVEFAGRLDRDEMARLYRQCDVMLNPSTVDNMPNSVLEAMASGVPIVSTNVGGVPYIVQDDRTALLVPPGDDRSMADAVCRVIENPALAQRLRSQALGEVQQYSWPSVRTSLVGVYLRVMGRAPQLSA
jgi:glycosyltransferase involved in cell wall biosynthesis